MTNSHDDALRVLVICTGNSARSQIAAGLFQLLGGGRVQAASAGSAPATRVNPYAVMVMAEIGVDIAGRTPKFIDQFVGQPLDYVIAVCSHAAESCPVFPGRVRRLNWFYDDPAAVMGSDAEKLAAFRAVRNDLLARIPAWLTAQR